VSLSGVDPSDPAIILVCNSIMARIFSFTISLASAFASVPPDANRAIRIVITMLASAPSIQKSNPVRIHAS